MAALVSSPPEKAMPTGSPIGNDWRILLMTVPWPPEGMIGDGASCPARSRRSIAGAGEEDERKQGVLTKPLNDRRERAGDGASGRLRPPGSAAMSLAVAALKQSRTRSR